MTSYILITTGIDVTRASTGEGWTGKEAFTRNDAVDTADIATKRFPFFVFHNRSNVCNLSLSLSVLGCCRSEVGEVLQQLVLLTLLSKNVCLFIFVLFFLYNTNLSPIQKND